MEHVIEIKNATKDYGHGRGVFDVDFSIKKGETVGLVGTSGAGKTTTLRLVMGFIRPDRGKVSVLGMDCWEDAPEIKKYIGYVPGEIAFPDLKSGTEFIKSQAEFLGISDLSYARELAQTLQLDLSANLKRMSKGMKQKTAIVAAFMASPQILILDEPTTGLDPLMRESFLELIRREKERGKTIFISSHSYEELQRHCDRVALIDKGRIVSVADVDKIKNRGSIEFKIEFNNARDYEEFLKLNYRVTRKQQKYNQITVSAEKANINGLFSDLAKFDVKFVAEVKYTLERYFLDTYKGGSHDKQTVV